MSQLTVGSPQKYGIVIKESFPEKVDVMSLS
jgi:hypothetical protein